LHNRRPAAVQRLRSHLTAALLSPDRATLSNLICLGGRADADWTADHRLCSRGRARRGRRVRSHRAPLQTGWNALATQQRREHGGHPCTLPLSRHTQSIAPATALNVER